MSVIYYAGPPDCYSSTSSTNCRTRHESAEQDLPSDYPVGNYDTVAGDPTAQSSRKNKIVSFHSNLNPLKKPMSKPANYFQSRGSILMTEVFSRSMHLKTLTVFLLTISTLFIGGCASNESNALSAAATAAPRHPESVTVRVTGGSEKSDNSTSQVSNPDFAAALTKSLQQSGLFAKIAPTGQSNADYQLEVTISPLQPPSIGASMTATIEANWTLTRHSNGFSLWKKVISASHTTEAKEAFTGIERVHLAIEGAAQENIKEGITQLGAVSLP